MARSKGKKRNKKGHRAWLKTRHRIRKAITR